MTCTHSHEIPYKRGLVRTYLFQASINSMMFFYDGQVILHVSVFLSLAEFMAKAHKTLDIAVRDGSPLTAHC